MNLRKLFATAAGVTAGLVLAGTASAAGLFRTTGNDTVWQHAATWTLISGSAVTNYPTTADSVQVRHDVAISSAETVVNFTVDANSPTITISSGSLTASGSLTVTGSSNPTFTGSGSITSGLVLVESSSNLIYAGSGGWTASDFQIDSGLVFRVDAGSTFTMADNGTGLVDGTLDLNGGRFEVAGSSAHAYVGTNAANAVIRMRGDTPRMTVNPVDGVVLNASSAKIKVDANVGAGKFAKIDGPGSVYGAVSGDAILINTVPTSGAVLLRLEDATLHGTMLINQGAGSGAQQASLDNRGFVVADQSGTLQIGADLDTIFDSLDSFYGDCDTPQWQAASGATLRFSRSCSGGAALSSSVSVIGTILVDSGLTVEAPYQSGHGTVTGNFAPDDYCP